MSGMDESRNLACVAQPTSSGTSDEHAELGPNEACQERGVPPSPARLWRTRRLTLPPLLRARAGQVRRIPLRVAVRLDPGRPRRIPTTIQIEATNKCNLRCPTCSHSRETSSGQHLSSSDVRAIVDWLPFTPAFVRLSGVGEPLVNPEFFSLADILAGRGIPCDFITNGTLLTSQAREQILSRDGIHRVIISCDGATESTFESCRLGARFESWKQLVGDLVAEAKQRRARTLSVSMSTVISSANYSEIPQILLLAASLGFDRVSFLGLEAVDDVAASLRPSGAEMSTIREEELLDLAATVGLEVPGLARSSWPRPLVRLSNAIGLPRCTQPWESIFVRANGDVAPCNALFGSDRAAVMGNVFRQSFNDVWLGKPFREFRQAKVLGTNPLCRACG